LFVYHGLEPVPTFESFSSPIAGLRQQQQQRSTATSPYEAVRSPSSARRDRDQARRQQEQQYRRASGLPYRGGEAGAADRGAEELAQGQQQEQQQQDLVSLNTLLETVARAVARRVFELHRGAKNKRLMAVKQHELSRKSYVM
jgi:hypothetical protein